MSAGSNALLDEDVALSALGPLREDIAHLEQELAGLEASWERVRASIPAGMGSATARAAAATAQCLVDERLVDEREAIRVEITDARRVAAERVRWAEREAVELVRLARANAAGLLLEWPDDGAVEGRVVPAGAPWPPRVELAVDAVDAEDDAAVAAGAAIADDDGFRVFWQEADKATEARSLALVPFTAALPMLSAFLLIVFSLLFLI